MEEILNELQRYVRNQIGSESAAHGDNAFALYVRLARMKREFSTVQLASLAGVTETIVIAIENSLVPFDEIAPDVILSIENALGISYERFARLNGRVMKELLALAASDNDENAGLADQAFSSSGTLHDMHPEPDQHTHPLLEAQGYTSLYTRIYPLPSEAMRRTDLSVGTEGIKAKF